MTEGHRDERPDPDTLLARIDADRARASRGRLKVFFGASPGVGKTYAMLSDAQRQRNEGRDVVVGVVETHGRGETERLVAGLEVLPRRRVEYRGRELEEFDLDAALARKPAILLVDELAHTNAPGCRHPKRYQDVQELLAAGIDVHTTVNVQHLESLNDVIGGITGIKVRETLPDRVFDEADEVVLVDLTPDDLLQRLREGKVYLATQAERAVEHFFRKGNLLALRELALRRTADRVDTQMRSYRVEHVARAPVWKAQDAMLVAIGPQGGDEALVRAGARLAAALDARWHAVYVETPALARLSDAQRRSILATLRLAEQLGAQCATLTAPNPTTAIVEYARTHNLGRLVVGRSSPARNPLARWRRRPGVRIRALAPDFDVLIIGRERGPDVDSHSAAERPATRGVVLGCAGALAISALTTVIAFPLLRAFDLSNIVMLFLLAVVAAAMLFGRGPAVMAAIANVLAFDFFFVPPQFTFAVSDVQYVFTFAVMLVVGIVVGQLTAGMRHQARFASEGEQRARRLFEMSRELSAALAPEQVAEIGERFVKATITGKCAVQILEEDDTLRTATAPSPPAMDSAIARWVLDHAEPAGIGTDTLPTGASLYLPLKAPMRTRGVLVVEPADPGEIAIPEQRRLLETCAALIAIALERVHFVTVAQRTLVDMESERLRNSVLAAISHDIRTPLTALVGLSDALASKVAGTDATADADLVRDQARRTAQLVDKLLDMARLEVGQVKLRKEWQALDELIGSALRAVEPALGERTIDVAVPADLPLVSCDGALIERVLVNLLENAAKYTPAGSELEIWARADADAIEVVVEDRGPGLPAGREDAMFEKFTRGDAESSIPGVGLGLAICRAIVHAHGGVIRAENRSGGGARFVFTLPSARPPEVVEPEMAPGVAAEP